MIRSASLFLLLLLVSLPYALFSEDTVVSSLGFGYLAHHFISTAAAIVMLYFFSGVKDRLTEVQEAALEATLLSQTDPLTGLSNRRHTYNALEEEMERARRYGNPLSVILLDIDDFKKINDVMGHDAGDAVLVELADPLRKFQRCSDELGRWGGEEFIFVAPETELQGAV